MSTKVKNLIQGLLDEMERVREIQAEYEKIPEGTIAATFMEADLSEAEEAYSIGDAIEMLRCYGKLKKYQL